MNPATEQSAPDRSRFDSAAFELPDLLRQRGLREVEQAGRPREAAEPRDGHEALELAQVEVDVAHNHRLLLI